MIGYGISFFTNPISRGGASVDPDAQAFITAASITDPTQQAAINTLVVDLKGYSIWTKFSGIYPFVGGTASQHKFNLKDPRDLDAAFRLVFSGGVTHSNNGVQFGGVNGAANTYLSPSLLTNNNTHVSVYSRTNSDGLFCDMGASAPAPNYIPLIAIYPRDTNTFATRMYSYSIGSTLTTANTDSRGLFISNRTSSIILNHWKNGVKQGTASYTNVDNVTTISQNIYIGALNLNGILGQYSNRQLSFSSIGYGLTDTEAANFYTAVQTFQTTLGRQVGTPIPFTGLLDTYSGASVAYSLRKLSSTYTGNAIRVRRSSDNAEQNIGFSGNDLDIAALQTFCSSANGFVTTWYDQSGNGRNAIQTTAVNQPKIVNFGSVLLTNGNPSIEFIAAQGTHLIYNNNLFLGANSRTILSVYKPNNSSGTFSYGIFGQSGSTNTGSWTVLQSRTQFVTGDPYFAGYSADLGNGLSTPNTLQKLAQFNYNGTTGYLYKNNSLLTSSNITLNALNTSKMYIGISVAGITNEYALANIQECIAWNLNQDSNTSGISTNINSFYGIY